MFITWTALEILMLPTIIWVLMNPIIIDWCSCCTIYAAENNVFTGTLPIEIELLTKLSYLTLGEWKYLDEHLVCLRGFCVVKHNLSFFESHYKWLVYHFTMNGSVNNDFNESLPSEIGMLTGLHYLSLGKWKKLVDHMGCLWVSCVSFHNLRAFDSHCNWFGFLFNYECCRL